MPYLPLGRLGVLVLRAAYKRQKIISPSSGGWTSKIKVDSVSGENFLVHKEPASVSSYGGRRLSALWSYFCKGTDPIHAVAGQPEKNKHVHINLISNVGIIK